MAGELLKMAHLDCTCYSANHSIRVTVDTQSSELWLETRLNYYPTGLKGFIFRCKAAFLYMFGLSPKDGHFDTFCFSVDEARKLRDVLDSFVESRKLIGKGRESVDEIPF